MPNTKVVKLDLKFYDEKSNSWIVIIPTTTGDMVKGRVNNSRKLDGKTADQFMPSEFDDVMKITDGKGKSQGIAAGRIVIGDDFDSMLQKTMENELYVQGAAFVENGKKVATEEDIETVLSRLLAEIVRIRQEPTYIVSADEPTDRSKLWIKQDGRAWYYDEGWKPLGGA